MNRLQQIEARLAEIRALLQQPDADLDALDTEVTALTNERSQIQAEAKRRDDLIAKVVAIPAHVARTFPSTEVQVIDRKPGRDSPEYRAAWLKTMAKGPNGEMRLGDLNDVERIAYTFTTTEAANFIPTGIQLGIVDMIKEKYALLGDLNTTSFAGAVEFQQVTAISAGDAAETNENTANASNLEIADAKVTMTGVEIRDSAKLSNKTRLQSIEQFEAWIIDTLSDRLGHLMNDHVFSAIDSDVQVANVLTTSTTLDAQEVRQLLGMLKGGIGSRICYANNFTIWNEIAAVVDSEGREKFIESSVNDDPTVQGRIYGTQVKLDETLADSKLYIGYPRAIKANIFEAPNVLSDLDVETREMLYAGYTLFEARLGDNRAFTVCTVAQVS